MQQGGIYVSCLGTTRADAGGTAEQEKVDLGLNKDLATRAKKDGASTVSNCPPTIRILKLTRRLLVDPRFKSWGRLFLLLFLPTHQRSARRCCESP